MSNALFYYRTEESAVFQKILSNIKEQKLYVNFSSEQMHRSTQTGICSKFKWTNLAWVHEKVNVFMWSPKSLTWQSTFWKVGHSNIKTISFSNFGLFLLINISNPKYQENPRNIFRLLVPFQGIFQIRERLCVCNLCRSFLFYTKGICA